MGQGSKARSEEAHEDANGSPGSKHYYPPLSDNRYKGLIYWWTFGELRADPDQVMRYVGRW